MSSDPERDDPQEPPEGARFSKGALMAINAVVLYTVLAVIAVTASWFILDRLPLTAPEAEGVSLGLKVLLGAGIGLAVFAVDQLLERFVSLFKRMSEAFGELLGGMTGTQALILALASSVGEEIFFRGFLQTWLGLVAASILFGLLHIAPDRRLWFWPVLAVAMGFAFGWLFEYTGDVLAPVLAHFTINYFSLMALSRMTQGEGGAGA